MNRLSDRDPAGMSDTSMAAPICMKHGRYKVRRYTRDTFREIWICTACVGARLVAQQLREIDEAVERGCQSMEDE